MKNTKRLLMLTIALIMTLALAACGGDTAPSANDTPDASGDSSDSDNPVNNAENDPDANRVLNSFGYADLNLDFKWGEDYGIPDAIGVCHLQFSVIGNTSDIAGVLIFNHYLQPSWTDDQILRLTAQLAPGWKDNLTMSEWHFDGQHSDGFLIRESDLGTTVQVLFFALDENADPIGHIQVPVAIPSDIP